MHTGLNDTFTPETGEPHKQHKMAAMDGEDGCVRGLFVFKLSVF